MQALVYDEPCNLCGNKAPHKYVLRRVRGLDYSLVECQQCGLRFYNPRPDLEYRLAKFYISGEDPLRFFAEHGTWAPQTDGFTIEQQWQHLRDYARRTYTRCEEFTDNWHRKPLVYEIGAWVGWFLHECIYSLGADPRSTACDANPYAGKIGHELFKVGIEPKPFQDASPPFLDYDFIFMNDVIEHSQTPREDLLKTRDIARDGGVLWIKTFLEELDEPRGRAMLDPPDHAYHFNRTTLRRIIEEASWKIVAWEEEPLWSQVGIYALAE